MNDSLNTFVGDTLFELKELRDLLKSTGSTQPSTHALQQIYGYTKALCVANVIGNLAERGWSIPQIQESIDAIIESKAHYHTSSFDLVLSGPEVAGIPTRTTHAVFHALIAEAKEEVLLVGYVIHNASALLSPLVQKMKQNSALKVWCCLDIQRQKGDHSDAKLIIERFTINFSEELWPWSPKPSVYFDPRSLELRGGLRSSLHAKCIIVDRNAAFVTSANFTDAAQHRNIEAGVLTRDPAFVGKLYSYFDGLRQQGILQRVDI